MYKLDLLGTVDYYGREYIHPIEYLKKNNKDNNDVTDLARITGGKDEFMTYDLVNVNNGFMCTKRIDKNKNVIKTELDNCNGIIRPSIESQVIFDKLYPNAKNGEIEYGTYPQMAPDKEIQDKLEYEYSNNNLNKTNNSYTFDSCKDCESEKNFFPVSYDEFEYNGKKYIRVKVSISSKTKSIKLSNGLKYSNGDYVWVEIQPVIWNMSDNNVFKKMFTKKGLLSGIRYNEKSNNIKYKDSEIKYFLDNYMMRDLFQEKSLKLNDFNKDELERLNAEIFIDMWDKKFDLINWLEVAYKNYHYFRKGYDNIKLRPQIYSIIKLSEEFDLNDTIKLYIMINFEQLFNRYGYYKKVHKNPYINPNFYLTNIADNLNKNKEAYIKYFNEDLINILKKMFNDNNLSYSDRMNIGNSFKYDFRLLSKIYPNIDISKIKDVILRCDSEENALHILDVLKQKEEKYQEKVLDFINPIVNNCVGCFENNYNLIHLKKYICNEDPLNLEKDEKFEDINIYFLREFDSFFMNIFITYAEKINNETLDKLLKLKDYVVKNIPKPTYKVRYVEEYVEHQHEHLARHSWGGVTSYGPDTEVYTDYEKLYKSVKYLSQHKKKISKIKKTLLIIIPMIINNMIDYEELLNNDVDTKYIIELINTIDKNQENENSKQYCLKSKISH